jgi:hypothetical protein
VKGICKKSETQNRSDLRIIGIDKEEVQVKGLHNKFNKIFTNLKEIIQEQEASRTPNRLDQNTTSPWHIIIKTTSTENRERILKAVRQKT